MLSDADALASRPRDNPTAAALPVYGVGIECPRDIEDQGKTALACAQLGILELIPESFFHGKRAGFVAAVGAAGTPVIMHSVEQSLGTAGDFRQAHFDRIRAVIDQVNCVVYSDHLCMTIADGIEIGQLTTLPFTVAAADTVCRHIDTVQRQLKIPFLIENITNRFLVPGADYEETEFINLITRRTGCGLLLDITNTYINSVNHGFDPYAWIDRLDACSIAGIHLAGGIREDGVLYDTHSRPVPKEVHALSRHVAARATPSLVIVEWDQDCPPVERLIAEAHKAGKIFYPKAKRPAARQNQALAASAEVVL